MFCHPGDRYISRCAMSFIFSPLIPNAWKYLDNFHTPYSLTKGRDNHFLDTQCNGHYITAQTIGIPSHAGGRVDDCTLLVIQITHVANIGWKTSSKKSQ